MWIATFDFDEAYWEPLYVFQSPETGLVDCDLMTTIKYGSLELVFQSPETG